MVEAKVEELHGRAPDEAQVDPRRLCVLCGKAARWRPVLLVVPARDYVGKPWRMQVGVSVCDLCRHPLPDELLGVVDKLSESASYPKMWDFICRSLAARGVSKPHYASTRVDYVDLDSEEARGHDEALRMPLGPQRQLAPEVVAEPAPAKVLSISDERALARARERRERRASHLKMVCTECLGARSTKSCGHGLGGGTCSACGKQVPPWDRAGTPGLHCPDGELSGGTKPTNETGRGEDDERSTDEGPERADL